MVRNRRRSTALKMALAGMCTALCVEGMLQRGLYVPVHAEDAAADLALTIEWLTSTPEELELFAVTAFGSVEAAMQNPTFAGVWAGYKEAKFFLENPSLEAVSNVDSITIQNLNPAVGYYYPASGILKPMMWYDLSMVDNLTAAKINGIPVASCPDFTIRVKLLNYDENDPAIPYIRNIVSLSDTNNSYVRIETAKTFIRNIIYSIESDSYFTSSSFNYFPGSSAVYDNFKIAFFTLGSGSASAPTLLPSTQPNIDYNYKTWELGLSSMPGNISMSSLPDIGVRQMFSPATATNWINNDFYPYVASQTEEGQPLEGFELTPPPGATPVLPDVGSLDSLTFPPGLPSVEFNDVELPSEPLPAKALQGAGFWFSSFSNMLDALGVKYIVITFLIIALIMAILKI